jgi:tetratricopeptide (TPR) repeat protein
MNYEDLIKQAEIHFKAYENSQAIECAAQAIGLDNSKVDGYYWRGTVYKRIDERENMKKDADALLNCTPTTALHFAYRGWAYDVKGNCEQEAIAECTKAIDQDDSEKKAYHYRAWAYNEIGDFDLAIKDYDKAIELDPKYTHAYNSRGNTYNKKGDYDSAIKDYDKAIELDPKYAYAYNGRGTAYNKKGDYDSAIKDYDKAIGLDPKYIIAYNNRGYAYDKKGDHDRAIEEYDKAIELDPKYDRARNNRLNAYHAKDENLTMKLVDIRKNREYMEELRLNIDEVIPFLGAGASKPYGYYTWSELLKELLGMCCRIHEVSPATKEKIQKHINNEHYLKAANELDIIFSNISSAVGDLIEHSIETNPIKDINKYSILSEYLHLFPNKKYLTTNYDTVVQDILEYQGLYVNDFYPTSGWSLPKRRKKQDLAGNSFSWRNYIPSHKDNDIPSTSEVYYLHGVYDDPSTIVISEYQYDDFYGMMNSDIKYKLRRFLPSKIFNIYHNSIFLYIGCGMAVKEDRVLKIIGEFYGVLTQYIKPSYALLNINEIANTEELYEDWSKQSKDIQENLNTALKGKETELKDMNVRVIWYSAKKNSVEGHESAKRQLFKYILGETREKVEKTKKEKQRLEVEKEKQDAAIKKQEREKLQAQFDNMSSGGDIDDSETAASKEDIKKIFLSEEQLKQVKEFFKDQIFMKEYSPAKYVITFPMYKIEGGLYDIYLTSKNDKFYLSDEGATYKELDKIFELKEPDVIKNLVAILKQYGCRKQQGTNAFIIDCTLQDINIKMSNLIQAISFMLNMKIFYV